MVYHPLSRAGSPTGRTLAVFLFFAALFPRASGYCCPGVSYFFENLVEYNPATGDGTSFLQNVDSGTPMTTYKDGIVNVVPNDSNNLFSTGILFNFDVSCNNSLTNFTARNVLKLPIPIAITATPIVALIRRGGDCTWSAKLANAISTSSLLGMQVVSAVIYDNETTSVSTAGLNVTAYSDDNISDGVSSSAPGYVPAIFVPNVYGVKLLSHMNQHKPLSDTDLREFVRLQIANVQDQLTTQQAAVFDFPKGWAVWVIIFGTLGLTGFIWYRWRRIRAYLLAHPPPVVGQPVLLLLRQLRGTPPIPAEVLETFPVVRFEPGACKNTECAICLEELSGGDTGDKAREIRVLPCQHGFCKECVGEWLLNNTALCPICKYNCFPSELRDPANSGSSENIAMAEGGPEAVGELGVLEHVVIDVTGGNAAQDDEITLDARMKDVPNLEVAARGGQSNEALEDVARSEAGTPEQGASGQVEVEEESKTRMVEDADAGAVQVTSEQPDAQS